MKAQIYHNILWSKYKGGVFSALHQIAPSYGITASFVQIAETEGNRVALGSIDLAYHTYPFELIFKGPYYSSSLLRRAAALAARTWRTEADLVILPGYERPEYWLMLFVLVMRRKRRAVFCDSTAYDRPRVWHKTLAKRIFFSLCHGFFGYGQRSKEYLMMHGVPEDKINFRCQAAALPLDYSEEKALTQRLKLAPPAGEAPRFLYVGRISEEKGLSTLVEAFLRVRTTHPKATLRIVGAGSMETDLKTQLTQHQLLHSVLLPGSMGVTALANEYASATALILPSMSEPWGLVVNEALSMGCPVIVSDRCGCVPELVVPGKTGLTFEAGNTAQLADRMLQTHNASQTGALSPTSCIEHMRDFNPQSAARQILAGLIRIAHQPS